MPSDRVDWKKAKKDYIVNEKSYREIAEEYGVSPTVIGRRGKTEKWVEERARYVDKLFTKTLEKSAEQESDALAVHYKANELMAQLLVEILEDEELRVMYLHSGRDLKDYMAALNSSEMMKRREKNILTMVEAERLAMEKKRLEIEEAKAKTATGEEDEDDTGVVLLAPTLEREEEDDEE